MQLNKGLNLDGLPDTVETGDYRYAENVVLDSTYKLPTNENGLLDIGIILENVCGIIPFDKGMIVFGIVDTVSNIKVIFTNSQTGTPEYIKYDYNIPTVPFDKEQPIRGTTSYNQRGDLICIFSCGVDGSWEDKIINFNSYESIDTKSGVIPNYKYTYSLTANDVYLLDINPNVQFPNITSESITGSLLTGSYQIAVSYKIDKEYTNYSLLSLPFYVYGHNSGGDGFQDGLAPNSISTEGIRYTFTDLDNKYKYYKIAVIFNDGTVFKVYNTPDIKVKTTDTNSYDINDLNILDISTLDEVLIKSIFYSNSESLNIMNNRLYRASLRGHNIIGFDEVAQELANNVSLNLVSHTITDAELSGNIKAKQFIKFQNDEAYALYLTLGDKKGNVLGSYPINTNEVTGNIVNYDSIETNVITKHEDYITNPLTLNKSVITNPITPHVTNNVNTLTKNFELQDTLDYELKENRTASTLNLTRALVELTANGDIVDVTNKDKTITLSVIYGYIINGIASSNVTQDTIISFYVKYWSTANAWSYILLEATILAGDNEFNYELTVINVPDINLNPPPGNDTTAYHHKQLKFTLEDVILSETNYNFVFRDSNNQTLHTENIVLPANTLSVSKDYIYYIDNTYDNYIITSSIKSYNYTATLQNSIAKDLDVRIRFKDVNGDYVEDVFKTILQNTNSVSFISNVANDGTQKLVALSGYEKVDFYVQLTGVTNNPIACIYNINDYWHIANNLLDDTNDDISNFDYIHETKRFDISDGDDISNSISLFVYPETTNSIEFILGSFKIYKCWLSLTNNVIEDTTFIWHLQSDTETGNAILYTYTHIIYANTKSSEPVILQKENTATANTVTSNKNINTISFYVTVTTSILKPISFTYSFTDSKRILSSTLTIPINSITSDTKDIQTGSIEPIFVSRTDTPDIITIDTSTDNNVIDNIEIIYSILGSTKEFNINTNTKQSIESYTFHGNNSTVMTILSQNKTTNILNLSYTSASPIFKTLQLTTLFKDINNATVETLVTTFNKEDSSIIIPSRHNLNSVTSISFSTNITPITILGLTKYYTIPKERDCYEHSTDAVKYTTNYIEITLNDINNILGDFKDIIGFWCIHRALRTNNNSKIYTQGISSAQIFQQIGFTDIHGNTDKLKFLYCNPDVLTTETGSNPATVTAGYLYEHISGNAIKNVFRFYSFEDLFNNNDFFPINKYDIISALPNQMFTIPRVGSIEEIYVSKSSIITNSLLAEGNNISIPSVGLETTRLIYVPSSRITGLDDGRGNPIDDILNANNPYHLSDANVLGRSDLHRMNIHNNTLDYYKNIYDETLVLASTVTNINNITNICKGDTFYSRFNIYLKRYTFPNILVSSDIRASISSPGDASITDILNGVHKDLLNSYIIQTFVESKYNIHARYWEGAYPDYDQPINTTTQLGYNKVYNLQNTEDVVEAVDISNNDNRKLPSLYPSRIIKSVVANAESNQLGFRKYLALDYFDMPYNRGAIRALYSTYKQMFIQQELSLSIASVKDIISYQDGATYVGTGQLFDRQPSEVFPTGYGYVGCESFFNTGICDLGYWVIDSMQSQIFLITDEGAIILTKGKCERWFKDKLHGVNPFKNEGSFITYDIQLKRFLLTVTNPDASKAFTISYIPEIKNWLSFHRYTPMYGMYTRNDTYFLIQSDIGLNTYKYCLFKYVDYIKSQLKSNNLVVQSNSRYNNKDIYKMILSIYHNDNADINKLYESISWDTSLVINNVDIFDKTFTSLNITNDSQSTGDVTLNDNTEWWDASKGVYKNNVWFFNRIFDYVINNKINIFNTNPTDIYDAFDVNQSNINTSLEWFEVSHFISTFVAVTFVFDNLYYSANGNIKGLTSADNKVQPTIALKDIDFTYRRNNR